MTDQPTWTVDEDGDLIHARPDGAYDSWIGVGGGPITTHITESAHAALVQHVRDAHRLHEVEARLAAAHRLAIEIETLPLDFPQNERLAKLSALALALYVDACRHCTTPDEAADATLAANEGENDG